MTRTLDALVLAALLVLAAHPALAAGSNMPWETPMQAILDSVAGPTVKVLAAIGIIGCGIGMAFGDSSSAIRRGVQVLLGISIAFGATSFFLNFLGFGGGALV
jgi:type IV secretion system protein VirB2